MYDATSNLKFYAADYCTVQKLLQYGPKIIINLLGIPKLSNLCMATLQILIIIIYTGTHYDTLISLGFQMLITKNFAHVKYIVRSNDM